MNTRWSIILVVGMTAIGSWAWAQTSQQAPLNPEFLQRQAAPTVKQAGVKTADGHAFGFIPGPLNIPRYTTRDIARPAMAKAVPSSYDLRTDNKVTAVGDQGQFGNCWTFATFGSMESCLLTGESRDFSENNLANLHGLDSAYGEGGDYWMATAYLGRWSGPVNESDDPYSNGANGSPTGLTVQKHVQQMWLIPGRTGPTDNDTIKQIIMTYGGVWEGMFYDDNSYNAANAAHYYCGTNQNYNHAVTMVGWDDNFDRNKFNTPPSGNGAFLIKNSWGTGWGASGYFWISYYDEQINEENCLFVNAEATSNYESLFEYDPLGLCSAVGDGSATTWWGANIFSASGAGSVKAVSFYMLAPGSSYEIYVYTGVTAGSPRSGTHGGTKSGSTNYAGYCTVTLDTEVTWNAAQNVSVVVKFTTPGNGYPVPIEAKIDGYSSKATASAGESFFSSDGSSWEDGVTSAHAWNVCIKAFGKGGGQSPQPQPEPPEPTARYIPLMHDMDGDNYGDPTLYDSSTGNWYFRLSRYGYQMASLSWGGGSTCYPLLGYFDSDWYADPTIYDSSSGRWYILLSSYNYQAWSYLDFGAPSCKPVCADFDGDLYADPTLYSASAGGWFILLSSYGWQSYTVIEFSGSSALIPLGGDLDGDGYADPTFHSPVTGNWYILLSSTGYQYYYTLWFGNTGATSALGDFDGDFLADPILRTPAGQWFVLSSRMYYQDGYSFSW